MEKKKNILTKTNLSKTKSSNNNTPAKKEIREFGSWDHVEKVEAMLPDTSKYKYRIDWGKKFCEWAAKPDSETIQDFCEEWYIDRDLLGKWAREDSDFSKYYRLGKRILANKTFKGWMHNRLNGGAVCMSIGHLDDLYAEMQKKQAELRNPVDTNSNVPNVVELRYVKNFDSSVDDEKK